MGNVKTETEPILMAFWKLVTVFVFVFLLHSESLVRVFKDNKVLNPTRDLK